MNITKKIDSNKIILFILVAFMILPSTISIVGVSMFKIATIIIAIMSVYLFIRKKEEIKKALHNIFVASNFILAIVIALSLLVNFLTVQFNDIFEIVRYIVFAMITVIILTVCQEEKYKIFLLKTISILMIIISIFGIIQYFNPFSINELYIKSYAPTQSTTLVGDYPTPRIVGTKPNPSVYGILVSLGIYFNLFYYKQAKYKSLCLFSIALCLINLMMTLTRTIQIAFLASFILYILIAVWLKKGWKKAILGTIIVIWLVIMILLILPDSLTWRLFQVLDFSNANSWMERMNKWEEYIPIIQENILFGIGPVKNHVHNIGYIDSEWIQMLLQYGILGFISYVLMLLSPLYLYIKNKDNKNILKYYIPILCIIFINNIASSSLISYDTAIGFYIIIGLILLENTNKKKEENGESKKSKTKNILMVATYFPPMGGVGTVRVAKYAKYLKKMNWQPTVVTIADKYITNYDETLLKDIEDVQIIKLDWKNKKNQRTEKGFYKQLLKEIDSILEQRDYDRVFITGGPFEPMKIAPYIYQRYHIPYVIDLRDPWKLQKINASTKLRKMKACLKKIWIGFWEREIFENAFAICTVNDTMTNQYQKEYPNLKDKFYTIPNGYDPEDYSAIVPKQFQNFSIVYAGKFGVSAGFRDPTNIFKAIKEVNEQGFLVHFVHIGQEEEKVIKLAKKEKVEQFCTFLGRKTYQESLEYCKGASILLVIGGNEKSEQTGKIFDYIGCQKPILVLANQDSEIVAVCKNASNTYCIPKDDIQQITNTIIELYQNRDVPLQGEMIKEYTREYLTERLVEILEKEEP